MWSCRASLSVHLTNGECLGAGEVHPLAAVAVGDARDDDARDVDALDAHVARYERRPVPKRGGAPTSRARMGMSRAATQVTVR
jgi:hypothetical protein